MSRPASAVEALADHRWLDGVWAGGTGVLLLLSRSGQAAYHRDGRLSLLAALRRHLVDHQLAAPADWQLVDAVPAIIDSASIEALLATPRPTGPTVTAAVESEGRWKLALVVPSDLIHFDDHFRTAPVLPGVMQVAWALALAAPRLGTSTRCRDMEALKFQRLLRPGDRLELELRYENEPGAPRGKLHFCYRIDGAHCSSGRLRVEQMHG